MLVCPSISNRKREQVPMIECSHVWEKEKEATLIREKSEI
jgi:hypothetical protein